MISSWLKRKRKKKVGGLEKEISRGQTVMVFEFLTKVLGFEQDVCGKTHVYEPKVILGHNLAGGIGRK